MVQKGALFRKIPDNRKTDRRLQRRRQRCCSRRRRRKKHEGEQVRATRAQLPLQRQSSLCRLDRAAKKIPKHAGLENVDICQLYYNCEEVVCRSATLTVADDEGALEGESPFETFP